MSEQADQVFSEYGEAIMYSHDDGRVTVEHADDLIAVNEQLWVLMEPPHRLPDGTLVLDTQGEYRYRQVGVCSFGANLVFKRVEPKRRATLA